VRYLGIDEIHLGKKKRFYTIVIDWEDGRILWAKPGRGKAALRGFWRRLRLAKAQIKAVAIDMSGAYWSACWSTCRRPLWSLTNSTCSS